MLNKVIRFVVVYIYLFSSERVMYEIVNHGMMMMDPMFILFVLILNSLDLGLNR